MSRVLCIAVALLVAALPAQADNLKELEQARQQALEAWSRVKADQQGKEARLDRKREERSTQLAVTNAAKKDYDESTFLLRSIRQSRFEQARKELRTLSNEVAQIEEELEQGRPLEQARRLRLIGAIRAYTDRLFEVAERALALVPPRENQADAMIEKALADLPLLEDLEQSKWVKPAPPNLRSLEELTAGRSVRELQFLSNVYRENVDDAQREARSLAPEHERLSLRLKRLNRLAQRGVADERLPVLIKRTREALGKADDVIKSFQAFAETYLKRAKELEAVAAERALGQGRRPGGQR